MKTFVIAEIGINHNGSLENAFRMIDAAAEAGCSAVKFQLFTAKNLYPKTAGRMDWRDSVKEYSYDIFEAVKSFELPLKWIDRLMAYCNQVGIEFLSSVFDEQGMYELIDKGLKKIKLSSYIFESIMFFIAMSRRSMILSITSWALLIESIVISSALFSGA